MKSITHHGLNHTLCPSEPKLTRSYHTAKVMIKLHFTGIGLLISVPKKQVTSLFIDRRDKCSLHLDFIWADITNWSQIQFKKLSLSSSSANAIYCYQYLIISPSSNLNHLSTMNSQSISLLLFSFFSMMSSFDLHSYKAKNKNFLACT